MAFNDYLDKINRQFQSGQAREHAYRPAFQNYIEALLPKDVLVTNEPARQRVGSPDFILTNKRGIPFAYIETKDIGKSLDSKEYEEQFERYKSGLDTLIITDYLEFRLYRRGALTQTVRIAQVQGNRIAPFGDMFNENAEWVRRFEYMIAGLLDRDGVNITIKSADNLARRMAGGARLFADVIFRALEANDPEFEIADGSLSKQYQSFKQILIGDITHAEFADLYAQTVTYGMFAARLHDATLEGFTRQEAAELIPKSNPFLRKLFQYVASHDLDDRIRWVVDDLAEVFRFADVAALLKDFGRATRQTDPMIHFYETFLAAYDPKLRDQRGVWYTPEPIVQFIVRAVDDLLKSEFDLRDGLADTSKTRIKYKVPTHDARFKGGMATAERDVHRVQLLDPACGTGTFLAETVRQIFSRFKNQAGSWNAYVGEHLVPRLHGFELLMASYAMAHIKLDLLLRETGYTLDRQNRFKIFLTNSLEEHHKDAGTLFWAQWLADEAAQADAVKRDTPVMVVIGNPPYSGISSNMGEWISDKIEEYKFVNGQHFGERKHWLHDDYVKFLRFGEYLVDKNGEGVLAFINNHSWLDNTTFRGMRWHLLQTFDEVLIIDLHGNAKKKEIAPDGTPDKNVFDIQQGVCINLFVKTGKKKAGQLARVRHADWWGSRESKYRFLQNTGLANVPFRELQPDAPFFFCVPKDFNTRTEYEKGVNISELFLLNGVGMVTARDKFCIDENLSALKNRILRFADAAIPHDVLLKEYGLKDTSTFKLIPSRERLFKEKNLDQFYQKVSYRPFDERYVFYNGNVVERPILKIMQHFLKDENLGLVVKRQSKFDFSYVFLTKIIAEGCLFESAYANNTVCPLYLYPDTPTEGLFSKTARRPNLNEKIVAELAKRLGRRFEPEKSAEPDTFCPLDVLDYVYAVLHTPSYRERYKEFLKIDFPRVPFPTDAVMFDSLVALGDELRRLHLLESNAALITSFPVGGDNLVGKISYGEGRVRINQSQYFEGVPEVAWQFYIGGYQPAQKWLKDRIGRKLSYDDIMHYQKVVTVLAETDRIMQELDEVGFVTLDFTEETKIQDIEETEAKGQSSELDSIWTRYGSRVEVGEFQIVVQQTKNGFFINIYNNSEETKSISTSNFLLVDEHEKKRLSNFEFDSQQSTLIIQPGHNQFSMSPGINLYGPDFLVFEYDNHSVIFKQY